jgi:hypothetical protein
MTATLATPVGAVRRGVRLGENGETCRVEDAADGGLDFWVRWQLAPGTVLEPDGERSWRAVRGRARVLITAGGPWAETTIGSGPVSPSFRTVVDAPVLAFRAGTAASSSNLATTFRRAP